MLWGSCVSWLAHSLVRELHISPLKESKMSSFKEDVESDFKVKTRSMKSYIWCALRPILIFQYQSNLPSFLGTGIPGTSRQRNANFWTNSTRVCWPMLPCPILANKSPLLSASRVVTHFLDDIYVPGPEQYHGKSILRFSCSDAHAHLFWRTHTFPEWKQSMLCCYSPLSLYWLLPFPVSICMMFHSYDWDKLLTLALILL